MMHSTYSMPLALRWLLVEVKVQYFIQLCDCIVMWLLVRHHAFLTEDFKDSMGKVGGSLPNNL
jgi:hypothetical protein